MKASAWQNGGSMKNADNDMMHVVDSAKRRIVEPAVQKISKNERLQRQQKKRESLSDRQKRSNQKLNRQENRLKEKRQQTSEKRVKNPKHQKSFSKKFKDFAKTVGKFINNVYEKEVKKFFACIAFPIIIILLVFVFIVMIFSSILSGGGFTLGTYAAQDYDLSEAAKITTTKHRLGLKRKKLSDVAVTIGKRL